MNTTNIELETKRLKLKVLNSTYASQVLEYHLRNKKFFKEWTPLRHSKFYSLIYQKNRLKNEIIKTQKDEFIKFWLFEKDDYDCESIAGDITFSNITRGTRQAANIGYKLDWEYTGEGFMAEAMQKAVEFGFEHLKLQRIEAAAEKAHKSRI